MRSKSMKWGLLGPALLLAATATAADAPLNGAFTMKDVVDATASGIANQTNATNVGTVQKVCRNGNNVVTLSGVTTHPKFIRIGRNRAWLKQNGEGKAITVRAVATGARAFNVILTCDKVVVETKIDAHKSPVRGRFRFQGTDCVGLNTDRATYVAETCEAGVDSSRKSLRLKFSGDTIKLIKIQGKGIVP